jgi:hypothetical protein
MEIEASPDMEAAPAQRAMRSREGIDLEGSERRQVKKAVRAQGIAC